MGKLESIVRSEIIRLARREMRKVSRPLGRNVRSLKGAVLQLRRTVSGLEKVTARQVTVMGKGQVPLEATAEEVKRARFSPRLIRVLRRRLGITQRDMAMLAGVTVGAVYQWEKGVFDPTTEKKGVFLALRRMGRREVKRLLEAKAAEKATAKPPAKKAPRKRPAPRTRKVSRK